MRSIQTNPMIFMSDRLSVAFSFSRRAHLLTTLKGSGISCGNRALCEADAAAAAASRQCHSTCRVLLSSSAQVAVVSALETACTLPAQTCHRQLLRSYGYRIFGDTHFLFSKEKQKERTVKTNGNLSSGSKSNQPWYRKKRCCSFRLSELF